jgi:hypothetical protein
MLKRRNFQLNSGYNCVCCDSLVEETIDHLFLRCPFSTSCWASLNIFWQAQGPLLDVIAANRSLWGKPLFMEIFMLAAWNIWKVRNNMVFNGINPECEVWKDKFRFDAKLLIHRTKPELHSFINSLADSL